MPKPLLFLSPVHRAVRQIAIYLKERMELLQLQVADGHLLSYLRSYAPVPITEISRVFGSKKSTLTGQLDRLEKHGLIRRELHPQDRRSFLVHLTEPGRKFAETVQVPVANLEAAIEDLVTQEDLRGFRNVMDAIAEATGVEVRPERKETK